MTNTKFTAILAQQLAKYNTTEFLENSNSVPNPHEFITIRGAREHNLKNISLVIPKNQLVVFSGLSGSGKSSLVFDTIYAEGQRRYVESLSSYARQFLGLKEKPDLDSIDGLSPAISIDQKSTANNPRSTVGTITEVYDYVRLLYAKIGKQHCAVCGSDITGESVTSMIEKLLNLGKSKSNFDQNSQKEGSENEIEVIMLAPVVSDQKGWHRQHLLDAKKNNFRRVRIDGQIMLLEEAEKMELNKQQKHTIEIVVDRLTVCLENKNRLIDSLETCLKFGENKCVALYYNEKGDQKLHLNKDRACPNGHGTPGELAPRLFSFNSPHGACPVCTGLGVVTEIDDTLVVPNHNLSITEGAIRPLSRMSLSGGWLTKMFETLSIKYNFKLSDPWSKLGAKNQKIILYGDDKFEGVITNLKRRYRESTSEASRRDIESYMTKHVCPNCQGARLKPEALAVSVGGYNMAQIVKLSISQALVWFVNLQNNETLVLENSEKNTFEKAQEENKFGNMLIKDKGKSKITTKLAAKNSENIQKTSEANSKISKIPSEKTNETANETASVKLSTKDMEISRMIVKEIILRLQFLENVGLKYLNLGRSADTLSGGEAQRIRLATQIGSGLTGVLYILDEPSIGLHQRDNDKLLETLEKLRDLGNTVIVVEHDEDTMRRADYLVDIGPKAGKLGGNIVAIGTPEEVMANPNSPTGQYLIGVETIDIPKNRRPVTIKGLRDVPKSLLIKELKEEWLDEVDSLIKD
jgi:excinuclease ABC subunit A